MGAWPELDRGAYLTDETRLFRVITSMRDVLLLEDCYRPEEPAEAWSVGDVLEGMRLVRPQIAGSCDLLLSDV